MIKSKNYICFITSLILLVFMIFSVTISVNAENSDGSVNIQKNKNYIVSCNDTIDNNEVLYEDKSDDYTYVLSGKELKDAIKDGIVVDYEEDQKAVLFSDSTQKWDLDMINFEAAETRGYLGEGIKICVLDSGVDVDHEDLIDNILPGYNVFNYGTDVTDNIGHGTFVSGMIAGMLNGKGTNGVAPKSKIIPIKCFDEGKSTYASTLVKAIRMAVDNYDCDIINMSAGIESSSDELEEAVHYATSKSIVFVAASGNDYDKKKVTVYPAGYDDVISVGSVDSNGVIASTSQRNESVTVAAPGAKVYSTTRNNSYGFGSGTSFATPIVTGIVADMLSINKDLSNEAIIKILTATATDKGDEGYDEAYGYGLVNLKKCIEIVADNDSIAFYERLSDGSSELSFINLGSEDVNEQFILSCYNDRNKLIDIKMGNVSIKPSELSKITSIDLLPGNIKCFLVDSNFNPIKRFTFYQ